MLQKTVQTACDLLATHLEEQLDPTYAISYFGLAEPHYDVMANSEEEARIIPIVGSGKINNSPDEFQKLLPDRDAATAVIFMHVPRDRDIPIEDAQLYGWETINAPVQIIAFGKNEHIGVGNTPHAAREFVNEILVALRSFPHFLPEGYIYNKLEVVLEDFQYDLPDTTLDYAPYWNLRITGILSASYENC
jgi:hypothetical protein